MRFITRRLIFRRVRAIRYMMTDKTVPLRKKLLIVFGIVYLFLPVDIVPPILGPFGFVDDLVLWAWILFHLRDTLDEYWNGAKECDLSRRFKDSNIIDGVDYTVDENEKRNKEQYHG